MTMPQTRHYEMKDSGVEWIGEMPSHWNTLRLQKIYRIKKDIAGTAGYTVLSVTQHGIKPKNMDSKGQFALDYSKYQLVKSGDFVMNHMDLLTGWVDISKYDGVTSPDYRVFTSIANCQNTFFKYIFQFCYMNRVFYGLGQGVADVGRWRLPADMFRKFMLPVPPLSEQTAIAAYLDKKCATIDAIIAEAKASIEEYKSWKAPVIFETVTKGLNPNAEMKDSGVEWIGEIPKGWKVKAAKYCVEIHHGSNPVTEGDVPVYGSGADSFKTCGEYKEGPAVLVGRKGATLHIPHYIIGRYWNVDTAFDVKAHPDFSLKFYYYLAICFDYKFYISQTTLPGMTQTNYRNMPIPVPPLSEQASIVSYLDRKCSLIDGIILEKEELIKELEHYKRSLIFEAVTGKRRVC